MTQIKEHMEVIGADGVHVGTRRASESATKPFRCRRSGDECYHRRPGKGPRSLPPRGLRTCDIYVPDLHIESILVKARIFR